MANARHWDPQGESRGAMKNNSEFLLFDRDRAGGCVARPDNEYDGNAEGLRMLGRARLYVVPPFVGTLT